MKSIGSYIAAKDALNQRRQNRQPSDGGNTAAKMKGERMMTIKKEKPVSYGVQIKNWNGEWIYDCYGCNKLWADSLYSYHKDRGNDVRLVKISEVTEVVTDER